MKKLKIAIIFGGFSSEYNVSLVSASSVIENIDKEKYDIFLIGVTKEGDFYLYNGNFERIKEDNWFDNSCKKITFSTNRSDHGFVIMETGEIEKVDIVFPIMHGMNGEDGRLQGLLELANIPYIGCDMLSSSICMNKYIAHKLAEVNGIIVPKTYLFNKKDSISFIKETVKDLGLPIYVKPLRAGSSLGITKVKNLEELDLSVKLAFSYDDKIVIEENIDGFEVGCAIIGNDKIIVGEVDEIDLPNTFFDYEKKYESKISNSILPARLSKSEREKIKETAIKIFKVLGCKDYARIDMFYTKEGKIVFNEINTIPGFTIHSRFPSMLKEIGYSFKEIIEELINLEL